MGIGETTTRMIDLGETASSTGCMIGVGGGRDRCQRAGATFSKASMPPRRSAWTETYHTSPLLESTVLWGCCHRWPTLLCWSLGARLRIPSSSGCSLCLRMRQALQLQRLPLSTLSRRPLRGDPNRGHDIMLQARRLWSLDHGLTCDFPRKVGSVAKMLRVSLLFCAAALTSGFSLSPHSAMGKIGSRSLPKISTQRASSAGEILPWRDAPDPFARESPRLFLPLPPFFPAPPRSPSPSIGRNVHMVPPSLRGRPSHITSHLQFSL